MEKPDEVVKEGQEVTVAITNIDFENKKISLSIRALLEDAQAEADEAAAAAAGEPDTVVASADGETTTVAPEFTEEASAEEAPAEE